MDSHLLVKRQKTNDNAIASSQPSLKNIIASAQLNFVNVSATIAKNLVDLDLKELSTVVNVSCERTSRKGLKELILNLKEDADGICCVAVVTPSGRLFITGVKNENEASFAAKKVAAVLVQGLSSIYNSNASSSSLNGDNNNNNNNNTSALVAPPPPPTSSLSIEGREITSITSSSSNHHHQTGSQPARKENLNYVMDFKIVSIVASLNVGFRIQLEQLAFHFHTKVTYEPEIYPAVILKTDHQGIVLLIFANGEIVFTKAKFFEHILESYEKIMPEMKRFDVGKYQLPLEIEEDVEN